MAQRIRGLGIDIATLVCHVVGMDDTGHVVLRKRMARSGHCQLIEADTVIRHTGTLLRSSLPLRPPAPYLSSRPNARIGGASRDGTRTLTADAVAGRSVGP
jgi:hypothetical protein